ncbi:MAG: hypothetical protein DRO52_05730 [Candidatus Hecatellales archaeon]|nr:MAG: hypothetical protein DRO52_05730 [Candidatus Hecatellales archaeon]
MLRSDFKKPTPGEHEQILSEMVSMIPPEASVLTQNHIFPHLCNRLEAYVWPVFPKILKKPPAYAQNTEYVLLDLSRAGFSMADYLFNLIEKGEYGVLAAADYVILLKKGYHGPPLNLNLTHGLLMRIYREPHPAGKPILEMPVVNASLASVILPSQNGCIELEGYLYTPSAGLYKFRVDSTDKFAFNLDGLESEAPTIQVYLQQGYHKIRILWYPEAERSHLNLCWKKPQTERYEAVSPKYLSPKTW